MNLKLTLLSVRKIVAYRQACLGDVADLNGMPLRIDIGLNVGCQQRRCRQIYSYESAFVVRHKLVFGDVVIVWPPLQSDRTFVNKMFGDVVKEISL